MLNLGKFEKLPKRTRTFIIESTLQEINQGKQFPHSLQSIVQQNRDLSVGCRLLSEGYIKCGNQLLTGKDIADTFIDSVNKFGKSWYPLTGDWSREEIEQLVLFVKDNNYYTTYARFEIDEIKTENDFASINYKSYCVCPDIYQTMRFKTLLSITNVQIQNLPQTFIGISSGIDVREQAFKGGCPNIRML